METLAQKAIRIEFELKAQLSAEQRQRLTMELAMRQRAEQSLAAEKQKRDEAEFVSALQSALAPPQRIAAFTVKLDRYDTATVQALMDNERDILAVREKIDGMLLKAHVLRDGRRVFATEDNTKVFDEFGIQVGAEELNPAQIDPRAPKWEQYDAAGQQLLGLTKERKDLIDYQDKLDQARERVKDPNFTSDELSALEKEVGETMPERVRKLAGEEGPGRSAEMVAEPASDGMVSPLVRDRPVTTPTVFQP